MSYQQKKAWIVAYREKKQRDRILFKLDLAEAFNYSYCGSQPPPKKNAIPRGALAYRRWQSKLLRKLNPEIKPYTIWDAIEKKKKAIKIN